MLQSSHPEAAGMVEVGVFAAPCVVFLLGNGQLVATVASLRLTHMNLVVMTNSGRPVGLCPVMAP